jgi:hypothetical protein
MTWALALGLGVGCGAKTGLDVDQPDGAVPSMDASPLADVVALPDRPPPMCTVFGATAELLPLDVFMLFDASGSMQEPTVRGGTTKWRAVRRAISRFFMDPESGGIGVGLGFFPQVREGVPTLCDADADCGAPSACEQLGVCIEAGVACNTADDCRARGFPFDTCEDVGFCLAGGMDEVCLLDGRFPCSPGRGPCVPLGSCENRDTCEPEAYTASLTDTSILPDAAGALLSAYDAEELPRDEAGGTPTLPAVSGTVTGAIDFSRANPSHKVVIVLATDGFPTTCDPDLNIGLDEGVGNVAAAAALGHAEADIELFVIGVFGSEEALFAQAALDRIAVGGGTDTAFVVNTAGGVTDEFLEALNQVRLDATACDFALSEPVPITGDPVWARITREDGEVWIPEVSGPEECGEGGFYFPDTTGGEASRIALCPESCALLGASPDRELEIFTVCTDDPTG